MLGHGCHACHDFAHSSSLTVCSTFSRNINIEDFTLIMMDLFLIVGFFLATLITWIAVTRLLPRGQIDPQNKAVMVTGCDTGFGHALAKRLDALGFTVFAGCLDSNGFGAQKLRKEASSKLVIIQMNVTSDEEVLTAVELVKKHIEYPEQGLWGLVNNAGLSTFGAIEWCPMDVYGRILEVNLCGMIRVTRAFLPLVRKSKGRVVNMGSAVGRLAVPDCSCYCVSKHGVEGFSQCLRYEMRKFSVDVSIIEPGHYIAATNIYTEDSVNQMGENMWKSMSEEVRAAYTKEYFESRVQGMHYYRNMGTKDISPVINSLVDALMSKKPRLRYENKELYWHIRLFSILHLPEFIVEKIF